jgi:UMP-CMP kinase
MKHLSAGELLRKEISTPGSEHGELIDNFLNEGKIVPVKIPLDLLKRQIMSSTSGANRFLIDGFPRKFDNVEGALLILDFAGKPNQQ